MIDDAVVGYGLVRAERLADGGVLGVIDDLYVDPEARSVGVGEAVMDHLHRLVPRAGLLRRRQPGAARRPGDQELLRVVRAGGAGDRGPPAADVSGSAPVGDVPSPDRPQVAVERGRGPRRAAAARAAWSGLDRGGALGAARRPGRAGGAARATPPPASCARRPGSSGRCGDLVGWTERVAGGSHFVILSFAVDLADPATAPAAGGRRRRRGLGAARRRRRTRPGGRPRRVPRRTASSAGSAPTGRACPHG